MSLHLKRGSGQFYVNTGADVTLIKRKCVRENVSVNSEHIIAINGAQWSETLKKWTKISFDAENDYYENCIVRIGSSYPKV